MARRLEKKEYFVVGTYYFQDNLMKLAIPNPEWGNFEPSKGAMVRVYKYSFKHKPLKFKNDPESPEEVSVFIAGNKVGWLNEEDSAEIRKIAKREVKYTSAFVHGGPHKLISTDGTALDVDDNIKVSVSVGYVVED